MRPTRGRLGGLKMVRRGRMVTFFGPEGRVFVLSPEVGARRLRALRSPCSCPEGERAIYCARHG